MLILNKGLIEFPGSDFLDNGGFADGVFHSFYFLFVFDSLFVLVDELRLKKHYLLADSVGLNAKLMSQFLELDVEGFSDVFFDFHRQLSNDPLLQPDSVVKINFLL